MSTLVELQIDQDRFIRLIALAREEDLGPHGDITTQQSALSGQQSAALIAQQNGVICGLALIPTILSQFDPGLSFQSTQAKDGDGVSAGTIVGTIRGEMASLLSCERTLLNFLQRLSGIATLTRSFVDRIKGSGAAIYDTRKTTPGWRDLEKYAVRCGGGKNHRRGLYDAVLVKDNHLAGVDTNRLGHHAFEMLNRISSLQPPPEFVEFEVDSPAQLEQLLQVVGIDIILLDNFSLEEMKSAVKMRDDLGLRDKVELEVSGGVTLNTVQAFAQTGIERISVGALTHSAPALDISLEIQDWVTRGS